MSGRSKLIIVIFLLLAGTLMAQTGNQFFFEIPHHSMVSGEFIEGQVVFKIKPELVGAAKDNEIDHPLIQNFIEEYQVKGLRRIFPEHKAPAFKYNNRGEPLVDLSRIFQLETGKDLSLEQAINELYATGLVEYAEPRYLPGLLYVPDDPMIDSQYSLERIHAFDAWDISKGDSTVIIGIVDTGNDRFHPDLIDAIAYNYDDPINGEDSDNDGFVDNFYGWDLGMDNNDPQYYYSGHGVHVSGIAAATPDNGTGIAGTGYHSRYLTVKVDDELGQLIMSYEGIVYAADRGASVINCSWGSTSGAGQYGRDIVNYATYNRDVLIVAAAGNDNNQEPFYPATYENALSVAATNHSDLKWAGSTYNVFVDLCAPGASILSTYTNATYINSSGTSMAAPAVSGAAAILRHFFPEYSARQIKAQLKVTTDNIDTLGGNEPYAGMLGTGRLNMCRALTETSHSYVELKEFLEDPESFGEYQGGQNTALVCSFENLLAPSDDIVVKLTSFSEWVEVHNPEISLGAMETGQVVTNEKEPFLLKIGPGIPDNHLVYFMMEFFNAHGDYAGRQVFCLLFNVDFLNLRVNCLSTTVTSRGTIGFNYPNFNQGLGFVFRNGKNLIKVAGFMAGLNTNKVVDNIYGAASGTFNQFFLPVRTIQLSCESDWADVEAAGSFDDSGGGLSTIGLEVDYKVYLWKDTPKEKFVILEYQLVNQSEQDLSNFYAGFFAHWLSNDPKNHRAAYDPDLRMGYAFSAEGGHYSGISLLTESEMRHYAFDNGGANGSINISDGFTHFEKYNALRTNRNTAGTFDPDNAVSTLVSSGPHYLPAGDTLLVAFAVLAGDHLIDLQSTADAAFQCYHGLDQVGMDLRPGDFANKQMAKVYPNPFRDGFSLELTPEFSGTGIISLLTMDGHKVWQQRVHVEAGQKQQLRFNLPRLSPGSFILQIEAKEQQEQLILLRLE